MSLNRIYWNGDQEEQPSEKINVNDLNVGEDIYYKKSNYNQAGEYLTCYTPGRATFLNLPKITSYEFALIGIEPGSYNNGDFILDMNEDAQCVDIDGLITSRSGNAQTINIDQDGIYWVTYKITRVGNQKLVKTSLILGNATIPGSQGTLPFNNSPINDESISVSLLVNLLANNKIKLNIIVYSTEAADNFTLKPNSTPPPVPPTVTSENSPSFISFLKVGV